MTTGSKSAIHGVLGSVWHSVMKMPRSSAAFVSAVGLSVLSMGVLGAALYFPAGLILEPYYGALDTWRGDWVWPAMILAGLVWSPAFLLAGLINRRLTAMGRSPLLRRIIYAVIVLGSTLPAWALTLAFQVD
ncbi:MAG: hypothetical protein JJ910_15495 [Maricaulis sp.]|nr:hypothetical protein [Maricaulis sp.]